MRMLKTNKGEWQAAPMTRRDVLVLRDRPQTESNTVCAGFTGDGRR